MVQVAFIAEGYPDTGFGNYWFPLFKQFQKEKWIVPVYIQHADEINEIDKPVSAQIWNFRKPSRDRKINRFFLQMICGYPVKSRMKPFDIIHLSTCSMSFLAPSFKNQRVVITCHDLFTFHQVLNKRYDFNLKFKDNIKRMLNFQSVKSLKKADIIIAISQNTKKDIINFLDIPEEKIKVVYNGIDRTLFKPRDKNICRQKLGLPPEKFILLNVGTENERKNMITLLKAMKTISEKIRDVVLIRIGRQSEASRKYIRENKLGHCVHYFPFVENIHLFYNAADISVFPSIYEGFGLVILEAMASGCPVITTNESAIPEVTGEAAIKVTDPFEPDDFYQAIKTIYDSSSLGKTMGLKGLERSGLFSWEKCAQEIKTIYYSMG